MLRSGRGDPQTSGAETRMGLGASRLLSVGLPLSMPCIAHRGESCGHGGVSKNRSVLVLVRSLILKCKVAGPELNLSQFQGSPG